MVGADKIAKTMWAERIAVVEKAGSIETTVVQSATPENVDTVMVDGRLIKRQGRLSGFDVPVIVDRAKRSALRIRKAAGGVLAPVSTYHGNPVFKVSCC